MAIIPWGPGLKLMITESIYTMFLYFFLLSSSTTNLINVGALVSRGWSPTHQNRCYERSNHFRHFNVAGESSLDFFSARTSNKSISRLYSSLRNENVRKRIVDDLNSNQMEAVTQPLHSICRVVAGPGAGKTRVLTSRIAYLFEKDRKDESSEKNNRILAVTFTKKAAMEMKSRLDSLVQEEDRDSFNQRVTLGTFHSICAKILRWHGSELKNLPSLLDYSNESTVLFDGSFTIVDQAEQLRIIKKCMKDCKIDLAELKANGQEVRPISILTAVLQKKEEHAMNSHDTMMTKDQDVEGNDWKGKFKETVEQIYPKYLQTLYSEKCFDFDDLILKTRELLIIKPSITKSIRNRWVHVLVDEFQDTSKAQIELVRLLTSKSLLVVGDGDQSIYSWRGAYAESMNDFTKMFDSRVNTIFLMENYRSTRNIVKAAQKIISDQTSSSNSNQDLSRQDMKPMCGKGPLPRILSCADSQAEALFVVKEIKKMESVGDLKESSTVALIYRTNAQSRALEEACVAQNLRYLVRGNAGSFYSRAEIKDCLCFLRWLYNGDDQSAMLRAFKTPSKGLGAASVKEFLHYCDEVKYTWKENGSSKTVPNPLEILIFLSESKEGFHNQLLPTLGIISKRTLNRLSPFSSQMRLLQQKAQLNTVSGLLSSIIDIFELREHFDSISKTTGEFEDRWSNVMELCNAADRYSNDGPSLLEKEDGFSGSPLGNFIDDVTMLTERVESEDIKDSDKRPLTNLMTIHAAKGLEFDAVFIVGNEEGTFPSQFSIKKGTNSVQLDEERRLCYVAMTRAKTHLVMTWRREVMLFLPTGCKTIEPDRSRFLDALASKKKIPKQNAAMVKSSISRTRERIGREKKHLYSILSEKRQTVVKRDSSRTKSGKDYSNSAVISSLKESPLLDFDSSMFYPIGTLVTHRLHGKGCVVLGGSNLMKVKVKFDDIVMDLPIGDQDLRIKY